MVWYNVENFFHPATDSLNRDTEFTPEGERRWSYSRYHAKADRIAQVVVNAGGWDGADIVGLCEVESGQCLSDLCKRLQRFGYQWVHADGPDPRGIDVALLYRPACRLLDTRIITPVLGDGAPARDILYACLRTPAADTVHLFLCHLPSQRGGSGHAEARRKEIKALLQRETDSLLQAYPRAKIAVVGDMNGEPADDLRGMTNQMLRLQKTRSRTDVPGTYKYQGQWSFLDQCYLSNNLCAEAEVYAPAYLLEDDERYLGVRPYCTFAGLRYRGGYSDHLPLVITFGADTTSTDRR